MPELAATLIGLALAALLGFGAHRAGVCTVKAMAEIVTTRRAHMLAGFLRAALWVLLTTTILSAALGAPAEPAVGWSLSLGALAGGFVFGAGAALNAACIFSTLTGLADGRLGLLLTLLGLATGVVIVAGADVTPLSQPMTLAGAPATLGFLPLLALLAWAAWEVLRLWRGRPRGLSLAAALGARAWRLSTAALVVGVANGVLFHLFGNWMLTGELAGATGAVTADTDLTGGGAWLLLAALFAGMLGSALQRGSLRLRLPRPVEALRSLAGGMLMGLGAAMVPGGNATLLLYYMPGLSPHAVPAYLAILLGIAAAFAAAAALGSPMPRVSCAGDLCRPEDVEPGAEGRAATGLP